MSIYISKTNQELLWNVISNNNMIQQYFINKQINTKHEWFKTIISSIYEKYKDQHITTSMLSTINKETISYMIQNIRNSMNSHSMNSHSMNSHSMQSPHSNLINTPNIVPNLESTLQENQYNNRVKDYETMNARHVPDNIDFSDNKDEYITDMDTLLQNQLKERANDEISYNNQSIIPKQHTNVPTLTIHNQEISINTQQLPNLDNDENVKNSTKKTVKWEVDIETNKQIQNITQNIAELFREINIIKEQMLKSNILSNETDINEESV